jgi:hypothetical protein
MHTIAVQAIVATAFKALPDDTDRRKPLMSRCNKPPWRAVRAAQRIVILASSVESGREIAAPTI